MKRQMMKVKVWLARYRDELLKHYPHTVSSQKVIMLEYEKILKEVKEYETSDDETCERS